MEVRELVTKLGFGYNGAGVAQYEGAVGRIKTLGAGLGTFLQTALAGVTVYALGRMVKSTIEFGDELRIALSGGVSLLEFVERTDQGLGDEDATVLAKMACGVG